ncbi:MAG: hypothetical protein VKJ06_09590 [Vampirovibrionales bacterium]|nr:hypothetical protein [Vampirovibrionales bacterium]
MNANYKVLDGAWQHKNTSGAKLCMQPYKDKDPNSRANLSRQGNLMFNMNTKVGGALLDDKAPGANEMKNHRLVDYLGISDNYNGVKGEKFSLTRLQSGKTLLNVFDKNGNVIGFDYVSGDFNLSGVPGRS